MVENRPWLDALAHAILIVYTDSDTPFPGAVARTAEGVYVAEVDLTGGDNGILGVWPEKWAAGPASFYWLSLAIAALCVVVLRLIVFSPFGYALRATRDSPLRR